MATAVQPNSGDAAARAQAAIAAIDALRRDYPAWSRRCYRIMDKYDELVALRLRPAQLRVGELERRQLEKTGKARIFILKGRQGGFTTDQQARSLHCIWTHPGTKCLTLADTRERTDAIFEITTRAMEHFPTALKPTMGAAATREISFPRLDSKFTTGTAGAIETGRGLTLKRFHGSEFGYWTKPKATLNAASPALERPGTVITLETTGSEYDGEAHVFYKDAQAGKNGYVTLFVPWWECDWEIYRTPLLADDELGVLEEDEQLLVAKHGLTLAHIKWRREKIGEKGRAEFLQEYAEDEESCWLSPGGMFYDVETLKLLLARAPEPMAYEEGGSLTLYAPTPPKNQVGIGPKPERVIIGCDTAEGTGGDRSTWVARTMPSWKLLAKYEDSRVTPRDLARILDEWGRRFWMALLVVEKNAHGITVLRHLRDDHQYPIDRIYHRAPLDGQTQGDSSRIGWATTGESKPLLLDAGRDLIQAIKKGNAGNMSEAGIRDAFRVRRNDDGKIMLNGKDVLVAEMLAWIGRGAPIYVAF